MEQTRYPFLIALMAMAALSFTPAMAFDTQRADVSQFIDHMHEKYGFNKSALRHLLKNAQSQPTIITAMDRPAEKAKPWHEYRSIFLTEKRIAAGSDFWIAHRNELDLATLRTGVAQEYIVAILGVETFYGRLMGNFRVLDALATLSFDYPARAKFFLEELEQFLVLTRETPIDPRTALGSYAGAMGAPQFMPSNYRKFSVDAMADGHIDLWKNWPDVFASVGNYFKEHGWISGQPVLSEANLNSYKPSDLDGRQLAFTQTIGALKAQGITFDSSLPDEAPAMLIAADEADTIRWRVGYQNFYAITRYNHSALYAMAVFELANTIKERVALLLQAPTGP